MAYNADVKQNEEKRKSTSLYMLIQAKPSLISEYQALKIIIIILARISNGYDILCETNMTTISAINSL